jgi:hypothetical protein
VTALLYHKLKTNRSIGNSRLKPRMLDQATAIKKKLKFMMKFGKEIYQ